MRKIETKQEFEKKKKRNAWLIGGIMIFIMLASTFGYAFYELSGNNNQNSGGELEYNGYKFIGQNSYWYTQIGDQQFVFRYNPEEVGEIQNSELISISDYSGAPLYIFSENNDASYEINRNLAGFALRFQGACLENEKNCPAEWPVKDCTNNFIIIKEANQSRIYQQENCVFIEAKGAENLTKATDAFLYKIFNIKN